MTTSIRDTGRGHGDLRTTSVIRTMQFAMHGLFFLLLIVGTVRAATGAHGTAAIIGAVVVVVWYAAGVRLARGPQRIDAGYVWVGVLVALWAALAFLSPEFTWVAFALYFLVLHVIPRPVNILVVALIAVVTIIVQVKDNSTGAAGIIGPTVGALVALGISWIYAQLRAESLARQALVQDLVAAQDDLLATQDALGDAQRRSGELGERARLARDIHDTLAQNFSSIVLLARAGGAGNEDPTRLKSLLQQIDQTASDGLTDARRVVHALGPAELDEAPLAAAIRRLTDRFTEQSGVPTQVHLDGTPRALPTPIDVTLLRITQGAIANVRQHADAAHVNVTLTYGDSDVQLDVADDGRGFDVTAPRRHTVESGGFGLEAMRQRVAERGGSLDVESEPGEGTVVHVQLPTEVTR